MNFGAVSSLICFPPSTHSQLNLNALKAIRMKFSLTSMCFHVGNTSNFGVRIRKWIWILGQFPLFSVFLHPSHSQFNSNISSAVKTKSNGVACGVRHCDTIYYHKKKIDFIFGKHKMGFLGGNSLSFLFFPFAAERTHWHFWWHWMTARRQRGSSTGTTACASVWF